MDATRRVLVLGATGRTGGRVVTQLLDRGVAVRAIVRSADRLPADSRRATRCWRWSRPICSRCRPPTWSPPRRLRCRDLVSRPHHQRPWRPRPAARLGRTRGASGACSDRGEPAASPGAPDPDGQRLGEPAASARTPGEGPVSVRSCRGCVSCFHRPATTSGRRTSSPARSAPPIRTCTGSSCVPTP